MNPRWMKNFQIMKYLIKKYNNLNIKNNNSKYLYLDALILPTALNNDFYKNIEILSGLSVGDKVIKGPYIAISQKLKDGTIISESKDSSKDKGKNSGGEGGISVSIGN